jgi:hypothetical protein
MLLIDVNVLVYYLPGGCRASVAPLTLTVNNHSVSDS